MDIVTHAMMGAALAMPYLPAHPVESSCFILGSVLPDLDALSRLFGKGAFLRCHQTFTHAIPIIFGLTLIGTAVLFGLDSPFVWSAVFVGLGMLLHSLLDAANTYGITLWLPFNRKRICYEYVFFIDAVTIAGSAAALVSILFIKPAGPPFLAWVYPTFLVAYGAVRVLLRRSAANRAPVNTVSLIPSALWPWIFYGYKENGEVETFKLNAITGEASNRTVHAIHDVEFTKPLEALPEYRIMKRLSPAYHVVDVNASMEGKRLVCRDLRTRNFGGSFGQLDIQLNASGDVVEKKFHV